jgi:hypothetical protein
MIMATFAHWLHEQCLRDGPVGDYARLWDSMANPQVNPHGRPRLNAPSSILGWFIKIGMEQQARPLHEEALKEWHAIKTGQLRLVANTEPGPAEMPQEQVIMVRLAAVEQAIVNILEHLGLAALPAGGRPLNWDDMARRADYTAEEA